MRSDLNLCNKPNQQNNVKNAGKITTQVKVQKKPIDVNNLAEMVVNVHPKNIPYSILALKNLWKGRLRLQVECMLHSSVPENDYTSDAKEFAERVSVNDNKDADLPTLKLIIIWKDVETTQFISSPSKFIPVYGEINIIRYLNRIGPNEFFYENDSHEASLHDQVLDICYVLSKQSSNKDYQQYLKQLSQRLGKEQFFNNSSSLSISDIAVSSIVKKLVLNSFKELPANLKSWVQKISPIAGY
jgi:aminoacyl tRNA synthase complex-interacting multifunctional protein 2